MKTFKSLLVGLVALSAATLATPAQADDNHRHRHDSGRHYSRHYYSHHNNWRNHRSRVVYYNAPRYYRSRYYYDYYGAPPYAYYRPYYSRPGITIAFGGGRFRHHHW